MAASAMTYGDDIAVGGRPTWDSDWFVSGAIGVCDDPDHADLDSLANDLDSTIGSAIYNSISNGGSDFLPVAAAHILNGLRSSLPRHLSRS